MPSAHPQHASPDEIAGIASGWDDDFIECRLDRHDFKRFDAGVADGVWYRRRRCPRCHTEQYVERSRRTGELIKRVLDYSNTKDGYLLPKGTGRITTSSANAIWLEMMEREAPVRAVAAAKKTTTRRRTTAVTRKRAS